MMKMLCVSLVCTRCHATDDSSPSWSSDSEETKEAQRRAAWQMERQNNAELERRQREAAERRQRELAYQREHAENLANEARCLQDARDYAEGIGLNVGECDKLLAKSASMVTSAGKSADKAKIAEIDALNAEMDALKIQQSKLDKQYAELGNKIQVRDEAREERAKENQCSASKEDSTDDDLRRKRKKCFAEKVENMNKLRAANLKKMDLEDSEQDYEDLCMICNHDLHDARLGKPINVHPGQPEGKEKHVCHEACLWKWIKGPTKFDPTGDVDVILWGSMSETPELRDQMSKKKLPEPHNSQCIVCTKEIQKIVCLSDSKYLALAKEYHQKFSSQRHLPTQHQIMTFSKRKDIESPSIDYRQAAEFLKDAEVVKFWASISDPRRRLASTRLLQRLAGAA